MTCLIVVLSSGKGTWQEVNSIISNNNWDKIFLICNDFAYDNYNTSNPNIIKLKFEEKKFEENYKKLASVFKSQIKDFEVAVNFSSGTGIEHMAILSAIQRSGLGFRFVYLKDSKIKEFQILEMPQEFGKD